MTLYRTYVGGLHGDRLSLVRITGALRDIGGQEFVEVGGDLVRRSDDWFETRSEADAKAAAEINMLVEKLQLQADGLEGLK